MSILIDGKKTSQDIKNEIPIEPSLLGYLERYGFKKDYAT